MLHDTPLRGKHEEYARMLQAASGPVVDPAQRPGAASGHRAITLSAGAPEYIPYGDDPGSVVNGQATSPGCEIVASYGEVEPEYAAIRRGAGIMDCPHRGTLRITGAFNDRRDFLNRMVTQELKDLAGGTDSGMVKQGFWLNRKGRIDADLTMMERGDEMFVDVDIHQAAGAVKTLSEFIFNEDVEIGDVSAQFHRMAVHGRLAAEVIAAAAGQGDFALEPGGCGKVMIDGTNCIVFRRDETGEVGLHLIVPYDKAAGVWEFLVAADHVVGEDKRRVRPIGWHAYNIARIEAGTPLMNIDFGPTNLPHETGVLRERVSFTKGCYLGQEIVARMESLGQPKQMLVGLKMRSDVLPIAGTNVFAKEGDSLGPIIGTVTSSTLSPMLGATPIAFAMIKTAQAAPGNMVMVTGDGRESEAVVGLLRFHEGSAAAAAARSGGAPAAAPLEGQP